MFQPPIILSMSSTTGYALQFNGPHSFAKIVEKGSGEVYVKPVLVKPTTPFATTSASVITAGQGGSLVVTSATNIAVGSALTIVDSNQETVVVTAISGSTITADFQYAHNGSATPLQVTGFVFPAAPTSSPAVSAGQARWGWYDLAADAATVTFGLEASPAAGTPFFPGASFDQVHGLLLYCVTATIIQVIGH